MIIKETVFFDDYNYLKNKNELIHYLKNIFEKKCYKKMYIKKINKILKKSNIIIDNNDFQLHYKVDFTLDINELKVNEGEKMKVKITDKHPKLGLISKNEYTFIYILNSIQDFDKININDIIEVKIEKVKYNKNTNKIVIVAKII